MLRPRTRALVFNGCRNAGIQPQQKNRTGRVARPVEVHIRPGPSVQPVAQVAIHLPGFLRVAHLQVEYQQVEHQQVEHQQVEHQQVEHQQAECQQVECSSQLARHLQLAVDLDLFRRLLRPVHGHQVRTHRQDLVRGRHHRRRMLPDPEHCDWSHRDWQARL